MCLFLKSTSEPFGVVFDCTEGGAVAEAAIDDCINGQEVCHRTGKETSIWEWERCAEKSKEEIKKTGKIQVEIAQGQED